jgi:hypothetical protein
VCDRLHRGSGQPRLTKIPTLAVQFATSSHLSGNPPATVSPFSTIVQDWLDIAGHAVEKTQEISSPAATNSDVQAFLQAPVPTCGRRRSGEPSRMLSGVDLVGGRSRQPARCFWPLGCRCARTARTSYPRVIPVGTQPRGEPLYHRLIRGSTTAENHPGPSVGRGCSLAIRRRRGDVIGGTDTRRRVTPTPTGIGNPGPLIELVAQPCARGRSRTWRRSTDPGPRPSAAIPDADNLLPAPARRPTTTRRDTHLPPRSTQHTETSSTNTPGPRRQTSAESGPVVDRQAIPPQLTSRCQPTCPSSRPTIAHQIATAGACSRIAPSTHPADS